MNICVAAWQMGPLVKTGNGSKTRLYQIIHTTESLFLIVQLAITRSKMDYLFIYTTFI